MVIQNPEVETTPEVVVLPPEMTPVAKRIWEGLQYWKEDPKNRWIKKTAYDAKGGFCAVGVVLRDGENVSCLASNDPIFEKANNYLNEAIPPEFSIRYVISYNDYVNTTFEDMEALFTEAYQRALKDGK